MDFDLMQNIHIFTVLIIYIMQQSSNFLNPDTTASPLHSVNDKSFVIGIVLFYGKRGMGKCLRV